MKQIESVGEEPRERCRVPHTDFLSRLNQAGLGRGEK